MVLSISSSAMCALRTKGMPFCYVEKSFFTMIQIRIEHTLRNVDSLAKFPTIDQRMRPSIILSTLIIAAISIRVWNVPFFVVQLSSPLLLFIYSRIFFPSWVFYSFANVTKNPTPFQYVNCSLITSVYLLPIFIIMNYSCVHFSLDSFSILCSSKEYHLRFLFELNEYCRVASFIW